MAQEDRHQAGAVGQTVMARISFLSQRSRQRKEISFTPARVTEVHLDPVCRWPLPEEDTSGSEDDGSVFREAPAQPAKSGQLALMAYSHRHPGRLAARMLLKMRDEVSMGSAGANLDLKNKTPATGVQYLLQILMPQMGSKANIRTQREMRTLMVILDLLAKNSPGRAADVVAQRVKALERATSDGAWASAQFLELIPSESSSLLDRDEQVYLSKEALLEQKLRQGEKPAWRQERPGKKGEKGKRPGSERTEDQAGKGRRTSRSEGGDITTCEGCEAGDGQARLEESSSRVLALRREGLGNPFECLEGFAAYGYAFGSFGQDVRRKRSVSRTHFLGKQGAGPVALEPSGG